MNIKFLFRSFLAIIFTLTSTIAQAETVVVDGIKYETDDIGQTAMVADNLDVIGDVTIPETITINSITYKITSIANNAFSGAQITSISIGGNVKTINTQAFSDCTELTTVTFGDGLESIGGYAFCRSGLTTLIIPDNVRVIQGSAFMGCAQLESVVLGNGVEAIKGFTFDGCRKLKTFIMGNSVEVIESRAFQETGITTLVLSSSVKKIESAAFRNCTKLVSITLGRGLESIGEVAFYNCNQLQNIYSANLIPPTYGMSAFTDLPSNCKVRVLPGGLEAYKLAGGWSGFGDNIIEENEVSVEGVNYRIYADGTAEAIGIVGTSLTAVVIPATVDKWGVLYTVNSIADRAFYNCTQLRTIMINGDLESIGNESFAGCTQLNSISIYSLIPPNIEFLTFTDVPTSCALFVPQEMESIYAEIEEWNRFFIRNINVDKLSAIELNAYAQNGLLVVEGIRTGTLVSVYTVSGILMYMVVADSPNLSLNLSAYGVYIIKNESNTARVVMYP